jgi:oligoendopeptidase F
MTMTAQTIPARSEVNAEDTWDITSLYADDAAWEADFARVGTLLPGIEALQGTLHEGPAALLRVYEAQEELSKIAEQVLVYASLRSDEDTANAHYQAMDERASSLIAQVGAATSWVDPELLSLSDEQLRGYLAAEPKLEVYTREIEELIRMRPHVRSAEVEELLAQASEATRGPSSIFGMFNDADLKFPNIVDENGAEIEVTHGRYLRLLENRERQVRRDTFLGVHGTYKKFRNTLAATYAANVRSDIFYARAHGYGSAVEARLKPNDIPLGVYENLISTVNANLPKLHRYLRLRKELLGLDELHTYDLYNPLTEAPQATIDFEQGASLILSSMAPLGGEYTGILGNGLESRWIDRYENKGKRSGAYSWGAYTSQPFILMNYQDNLNSVFTLAHELGHSMHSYFTRQTQPYAYGHYTLFVAEVASTLNEALLAEHILKTTDDPNLRLQLVIQQIDDIRGTLLRQTLFAEFELAAHRMAEAGQALTADTLSNLYRGLIETYYGPELTIDDDLDIEWARIPHFYRSFYVYQYATGISAALALADKILHEGDGAAAQYVNFLRGGSSKSSIDLLRGAGVDMTTPEPIQRAMNTFDTLIDNLEELTAKR